MQLQFHPGSSRGTVRTLSIGPGGVRALTAAAAAFALLAVSLWFTVPAVALRLERDRDREGARGESQALRAEEQSLRRLAADLRLRARSSADLMNRIAFLYGVAPPAWPRVLGPEHPLLGEDAPERVAERLPRYLRALDRGFALLAAREAEDPALPREVPAILPIGHAVFEPAAHFGPRRSPWTGEDEFLSGVEIAAPAGSAVVAPGEGVVAFAGTVRRGVGVLWQLGNVVVLSHGARGATIFGHLGRVDVRPGQRVVRGAPLGLVGSSGWAVSPRLRYEYWRPDAGELRPTDPLFAVLDSPLESHRWSLAQMEATWAPGPVSPLPGIGMPAESAAAPGPQPVRRVRGRKMR
ncbi:MAG: M23 family metallopeptidase [Acidobacteria bacterium]|nr:M23 family metallopeptidase [Acidobacteriota bacterium]MCA1611167.1 M23 family metallopeptidase [Acidobacteriota bacterium]